MPFIEIFLKPYVGIWHHSVTEKAGIELTRWLIKKYDVEIGLKWIMDKYIGWRRKTY